MFFGLNAVLGETNIGPATVETPDAFLWSCTTRLGDSIVFQWNLYVVGLYFMVVSQSFLPTYLNFDHAQGILELARIEWIK